MTKNQLTIRDNLTGCAFKDRLNAVLPKHLSADRMVAVALSAMTKTPKLAGADVDQPSFFKAMMTLSEVGLEPNGIHAHLIPFKNNRRNCTEVQLVIDYKGLVLIASRAGFQCSAFAVYEGDEFDWSNGECHRHVPHFLLGKEAGNPIAYVARIVDQSSGLTHYEIMSLKQVDKIRKESRAGSSGPWVTHFDEMAKKTVFRRAAKWLPLGSEAAAAVMADDDKPASVKRGETIDAEAFRDMLGNASPETVDSTPAPVGQAKD